MLTRRQFVAASAASVLAASAGIPTRAQTVAKPARLLVGFPPGGSTDIVARLLVERIRGYASSIIVENRPGAGGRLALEFAKSGPADGSLAILSPMSMIVIYPHTHRALGYRPMEDFVAVTTVCEFPFVISTGPLVPPEVRTLAQFIAWCRENPRQALYSTSGAGSTLHFIGVMLARAARFEFVHVPYNGAPAAQQDVIGGRVAANVGVLGTALPQIKAGNLRALATSGPARSRFLPEVPTFKEAGFPDVVASEWQGLFVPANTPAAIVEALNRSTREALQADEVRAGLSRLAFEIRGNAWA